MDEQSMSFDLLVVGAGPAGLATAIRMAQLAQQAQQEVSIAVLEKSAAIGGHILSGAVMDPKALHELFPDLEQRQPDWGLEVSSDDLLWLRPQGSISIPSLLRPASLDSHGCRVLSLGNLCRWLAAQAEAMGINVFPGFSASELIYQQERVIGVRTGALGLDREGQAKSNYQEPMVIYAKSVVLAEGARGHLGKEVITRFGLDQGKDPQHYALGFKELWDIPSELHQPGKVVHTLGWPLSEQQSTGGGFIYHQQDQQLAIGLIVDLNYQHPDFNPFLEFQRFKSHPEVAKLIAKGKLVSYGARAIAKGGWQSLVKMDFPGGLLVGCDAGTLNPARIKGSHSAIKSGSLAAEAIWQQWQSQASSTDLELRVQQSWLGDELYRARNVAPAMHRLPFVLAGALITLEQKILAGKAPWTLSDPIPDHLRMKKRDQLPKLGSPVFATDRLQSIYHANLQHDENQPQHLLVADPSLAVGRHWQDYGEPATRYCPAGVYEVVEHQGELRFQVNGQNCLHCKTCDIKDPSGNINWRPPEGGSGPNYPNM